MNVGILSPTGMTAVHNPRRVAPVSTILSWLIPGFTAISICVLYRLHLQDYQQSASWGCEMSWMTPSYIHIDAVGSPVPRYQLYLYREHGWDTSLKPEGHPVLFVPGNAGSYQQVRSIASSASRQYYGQPGGRAVEMEHAGKVDLYALDFNEDLSAFHGSILRQQADYLAFCVHHVLSLYDHLPPLDRPRQVTLLAHSMGGIVSRLAALTDIDAKIDVIFTMSTPHLLPPVTLDADIQRVYDEVNTKRPHNNSAPLLLSICGGLSDSQIVSDHCSLSHEQTSSEGGLAIFTTGLPGVWTGVDHQAMVWCHQIRWRVARTLLEMAGKSSREQKLATAKSWLLGTHQIGSDLDILDRSRDFRLLDSIVKRPELSVILQGPSFSSEKLPPAFSLFQCDDGGNDCQAMDYEVETIPWGLDHGSPFPFPGEGSRPRDVSHVVTVQSLQVGRRVQLWAQSDLQATHGIYEQVQVSGSTWSVIPESAPTTRLSVEFSDIGDHQSSLDVWNLDVKLGDCQASPPIIKHKSQPGQALLGLTSEERFYSVGNTAHFTLHSHIGRSPYVIGASNKDTTSRGIVLEVYQSPSCPVQAMSISRARRSEVSKALLRFRMTLVAWTFAWTAVLVAAQLLHFDSTGVFPDSYNGLTRKFSVWAVASIMVVFAAQGTFAEGPFGLVMLLGAADISHLWICLGMAVGSLGFVYSAGSLLTATRAICQLLPSLRRSSVRSASWDYKALMTLALWLGLGWLFLPQQLVRILLFLVQWAAYVTSASTDPSLLNFQHSIILFQLFLLPQNLTILAVWARTALVDWRHMPRMDHNSIKIIPILGLMELSGRASGVKRRKWSNRVATYTFIGVSTASFMYGPRYTYTLPIMADLAVMSLWLLLWPRR